MINDSKIIVVGKTKSGGERSLILSPNGICNCLSATDYKQPKQIGGGKEMLRIRKLVPAECFILMGFTKEDADRLSAAGISNTQLYKMAGNSIVVPCLEGIFKEIYK